MIDPIKIFEILKARNDLTARAELELLFNSESELSILTTVGLKTTAPAAAPANTVFGSYATTTNDQDQNGASVFAFALFQKLPSTASLILDKVGSAILLKKNDKGENGFHAVARYANLAFLSWFLKQSIFAQMFQLGLSQQFKEAINALTPLEENLITLDYAEDFGLENLQDWVTLGVDPQGKVKSGNLLHFFVEKRRPDLVGYLGCRYPNLIMACNDKGQYPIHLSCARDNLQTLDVLIKCGSPVCVEDRNFNRPLHYTLNRGNVEGASLILSKQQSVLVGTRVIPYVNLPNAANESPLHILVHYAKELYTEQTFSHALDLLIQYGADFTLVNDENQTPLRVAKKLLSTEKFPVNLFQVLWLKINQKYNPQLFTRDTLYQRISQHYSPEIVQNLIQALDPVMTEAGPEVFKLLHEGFINQLKQAVAQAYPGRMDIIQGFSMVLEQGLAQQKIQRTPSQPVLHQWQQAQPTQAQVTQLQTPARQDNFMDLGNASTYNNH